MLLDTRVVDVHHHFLPRSIFDDLKRQAGGKRRLVNEKISITLNEDLHSVPAHLTTMDQGSVDAAILTYSGVSILGAATCTKLNDGFAEIQANNRGKLYGAVHVPISDPSSAPAEIERGVKDLGLVAVALPTSEPGVTLDSEALHPLWRAIEQLDVPVILHPALLPEGASTDYGLERSCARPFDTTVAAVRIIYGVFPKFPKLKFVLPHLGGTSMFLKGRLQMFFEPANWPGEKPGLPVTQREQKHLGYDKVFEEAWSKFYFDTAGNGGWAPAVEMAARVVTCAKILFGSDFPLESHSGETVAELTQMIALLDGVDPAGRRQILGENAAALFRL